MRLLPALALCVVVLTSSTLAAKVPDSEARLRPQDARLTGLLRQVEVIEDESVTDEASLIALYRRIGRQSGAAAPMRWETVAAQETGFKVRRELVAAPASTVARSGDTRS